MPSAHSAPPHVSRNFPAPIPVHPPNVQHANVQPIVNTQVPQPPLPAPQPVPTQLDTSGDQSNTICNDITFMINAFTQAIILGVGRKRMEVA